MLDLHIVVEVIVYLDASSFTMHHSFDNFFCHLSSYSNKGDITVAETPIYCEIRQSGKSRIIESHSVVG